MKYLLKNRSKETIAWGGTYTDESFWENIGQSNAFLGNLAAIESIAFYWNPLDSVSHHIQCDIQSEDAAFIKGLVDMFNGYVSLAKLGSIDGYIKELLNNLDVTDEKDGIRVDLTFTNKLLEYLENNVPQLQKISQ